MVTTDSPTGPHGSSLLCQCGMPHAAIVPSRICGEGFPKHGKLSCLRHHPILVRLPSSHVDIANAVLYHTQPYRPCIYSSQLTGRLPALLPIDTTQWTTIQDVFGSSGALHTNVSTMLQ